MFCSLPTNSDYRLLHLPNPSPLHHYPIPYLQGCNILCILHGQCIILVLHQNILQWQIQDGAFGANPLPPSHCGEAQHSGLATSFIEMIGQNQFSYIKHANYYHLLQIHLKLKSK